MPLKSSNRFENLTVLVVEDEPVTRSLIAKSLSRTGLRIIEASDGKEAWYAISSENIHIDVILSDLQMPYLSGLELLQKVRSSENFSHIPFMILTSEEKSSKILELFNAGASDYIKKPFLKEELLARLHAQLQVVQLTQKLQAKIEQLQQANQELERISLTDPLTQLPNRRHFVEKLTMEVYNRDRYQELFSLIMLDIDFFKKINDSRGHQVGDYVLQELAQRIQLCLRRSDLPARVGGEEFAILIPRTSVIGAQVVAEKIRANIAEKQFLLDREIEPIDVHISVGVLTSERGDLRDADALYKAVDQLLYQAKESGRNQVVAE